MGRVFLVGGRGFTGMKERIHRTVWQSVTSQTAMSYRSAAAPWLEWLQCKFGPNPPHPTANMLLSFLAEVKDMGWSFNRANMVRNYVQKENTANGFPEIARNETVSQFMLGYKKSVPVQRSRGPLHKKDLDVFHNFLKTTKLAGPLQHKLMWMCVMAYFACLRMSEVLGIRKSDFKFTEKYLQIWIQKSKNWPEGTAVQLPVGDPVWDTPNDFFRATQNQLSQHADGFLFSSAMGEMVNSHISNCFSGNTKIFFSFHSWRHGRVTDLYEKLSGPHKVRLDAIAAFGKWKCRSTVAIYLHIEKRGPQDTKKQGSAAEQTAK